MYSDENRSSSLAKLLNGFDQVILDTSSLMVDGFPSWMDVLANAKEYVKEELKIIVFHECLEELKKHSKDKKNPNKVIASKRAIKILKSAKRRKLLEIGKKEKASNFADNVIYSEVSKLRIHNKILVITEDKDLAEDLRKLNTLGSQLGKKVTTFKILPNGQLDVNRGNKKKHNIHRDFIKAKDDRGENNQPKQRPLHNKPKKEDLNQIINKIIAEDKKLNANLNNPNFKKERKEADIKAQLSLFAKLPEDRKKGLQLTYSEPKLKEELLGKKTKKKIQEAPSKEDKKAKNPYEWYGEGNIVSNALLQAASHHGLVFRDFSIPYSKKIHGDVDLTQKDLKKILSNFSPNGEGDFEYKDIGIKSKKSKNGYHVWLNLSKIRENSSKKAEKKVVKQEPQQDKKPSKALEEALKVDFILQANLNNPNYPLESKRKDIAEQIERIKTFNKDDADKLTYKLSSLKAMLSVMGEEKNG